PEVWKSALDGLVSIASPMSRQVVERAREKVQNVYPERVTWLKEAIDQINETLVGSCNSRSKREGFHYRVYRGMVREGTTPLRRSSGRSHDGSTPHRRRSRHQCL